jgi:hypothetical protein
MAEAPTPIWIQLTVPVITAVATAAATWATSKLDLFSYHSLKQYEGSWFAYYRDPDTRKIENEIWEFTKFGNVSVKRNGRETFKGRLVLKQKKAYMQVENVQTGVERLLIMLDPPNYPRIGGQGPSHCLWLGQNNLGNTTAGHGLISRDQQNDPQLKDEFIFAV